MKRRTFLQHAVAAPACAEIASIPKRIGDLSQIRPRPTSTPYNIKLERPRQYVPGPAATDNRKSPRGGKKKSASKAGKKAESKSKWNIAPRPQ